VVLVASTARLTRHSLLLVIAAQVAWHLVVAALMIIQPGPFGARSVQAGA
jgi:hypothetical protein